MHSKKVPFLLFLLFACSHNHALAQEKQISTTTLSKGIITSDESDEATYMSYPVFKKGKSMVTLSEGIVTLDEFNGVTYTSYMDIPNVYSGALFLSYRVFSY